MGIWSKLKSNFKVEEKETNQIQQDYVILWKEDYLNQNLIAINENSSDIAHLNISLKDFSSFIESLKLQLSNIKYGNTGILDKNIRAFGKDKNAIFVEYQNDSIKNIWLGFYHINQENADTFSSVLNQISNKYHLNLKDNTENQIIDLSNMKTIHEYLMS